jgi:hypothetical protein
LPNSSLLIIGGLAVLAAGIIAFVACLEIVRDVAARMRCQKKITKPF